MIKNVIFDIGNVLLTYHPAGYLAQKFADNTAKGLYDTIFASKEWLCLDRGTLTVDAACKTFIGRRPDLEREILVIMRDWHELMKPIGYAWDAVYELINRGFHLYYLSNMGKSAAEYMIRNHYGFRGFTGGMFSCDVQSIKPERRIYEEFLAKYSLNAEECVFFDDSEPNIIAAREIGMRGFVFGSEDSFADDMHTLMIQD